MEIKKIFTESPEEEQWDILQQYTYTENIRRFLSSKGITTPTDALVEGISGSILQAKEYYDASKNSSLHISPLLLYYGTTNLFRGISNLTSGTTQEITDHGMSIEIPAGNNKLANVIIHPRNPTSGALTIFNTIYSSHSIIHGTGGWTLLELLGSIPDLRQDFLNCYQGKEPHVIPIEIVIEKEGRTLERIEIEETRPYANIEETLLKIENLNENYLPPQIINQYIILRPKLTTTDIGIYSLSGRKYLQVAHLKNATPVTPSTLIIIFMACFALGFICRYHPEIWTPFLRTDITGERLLIEKFIKLSRRLIPNLILDSILGVKIRFVAEQQGLKDLSFIYTKAQIEEIVSDLVQKMIAAERFKLQ